MSRPHSLTPADVAACRAALERRLRALNTEIAADRDKVDQGSAGEPGDVLDRKDQADSFAQAGIVDAELARDLAEAHDVRAALDRLAAGDYGRCIDCDESIGRERLLVQPAAARCAACQTAAERPRAHRTSTL